MEPRSSPFRLLLGPPLIAMGLAGALAYWLGSGDSEPAAVQQPAPVAPPSVASAPAAPRQDPAPQQPPPAQPTPVPPGAPPAAAATPAAPPPPESDDRFADAAVREHAQMMLIETSRHTLKMRDLAQLQNLRKTLRDQNVEHLVAPADLQGIDIGIECLSQLADAKNRALDFLEDHPSSPLAEELRGACQ